MESHVPEYRDSAPGTGRMHGQAREEGIRWREEDLRDETLCIADPPHVCLTLEPVMREFQ